MACQPVLADPWYGMGTLLLLQATPHHVPAIQPLRGEGGGRGGGRREGGREEGGSRGKRDGAEGGGRDGGGRDGGRREGAEGGKGEKGRGGWEKCFCIHCRPGFNGVKFDIIIFRCLKICKKFNNNFTFCMCYT